MGEAHDMHGLHGFLEVVLVLLARDRNVSIGQEAVVIESLQEQIGWEQREMTLNYTGTLTAQQRQGQASSVGIQPVANWRSGNGPLMRLMTFITATLIRCSILKCWEKQGRNTKPC